VRRLRRFGFFGPAEEAAKGQQKLLAPGAAGPYPAVIDEEVEGGRGGGRRAEAAFAGDAGSSDEKEGCSPGAIEGIIGKSPIEVVQGKEVAGENPQKSKGSGRFGGKIVFSGQGPQGFLRGEDHLLDGKERQALPAQIAPPVQGGNATDPVAPLLGSEDLVVDGEGLQQSLAEIIGTGAAKHEGPP
jgi:hypothetical protein